MSIQKLIQKLIPFDELYETVRRFPLSVFCALGLFIIGILAIHDFIDEDEELIWRLASILGCCYFWFGVSKLMSESQGWNLSRYLLISFVVAGAIIALFSLSAVWGVHLIFVIPALLLSLMVAPYLTSGDDISVWFFNRMIWFGVIVSYAALIMFAGGLSVALFAIDTLFNVYIDGKVYDDIWLFASLVLGPVYALSWVPKTFQFSDDDCNDPPGLKFIVNWISAPMVFVYLLILYAYFIKIIVTGDIPSGHLAYMISGFAGVGVVAYLAAWPIREEGSLQLKLFYKTFFPVLLIPVGFHFYAIWERISAYGITEQRYLILLSAIWFLIISFSNSFNKIPIKAIPMTLAILMVFASFGPWGGVSVSGLSQFSRLEKLMIKNKLLTNDEITKAEGKIPFNDRKSISSILDYLCDTERDAMIEKWFNTKNEKNWECSTSRYALTKQLGFDYVSRYYNPNNDRFYLNAPDGDVISKNVIDVSQYDVLIKNVSVYIYNKSDDNPWRNEWIIGVDKNVKMEFSMDGHLNINIDTHKTISIDVNVFVAEKLQFKQDNSDLVIESENEDIAYRLYFDRLSGKIKNEIPVIEDMTFDFFYRVK